MLVRRDGRSRWMIMRGDAVPEKRRGQQAAARRMQALHRIGREGFQILDEPQRALILGLPRGVVEPL